MVRDAVEDRGVPQDTEVRLQGRRVEAQNRGAARELDLGLLHLELAGVNRSAPEAPPSIALTKTEIELLDRLVRDRGKATPHRKTIGTYLTKIARLGGYLARATDPPPGNMVMWKGLSRLTDIELGAAIGAQIVGN
jgi:hypothetical protein